MRPEDSIVIQDFDVVGLANGVEVIRVGNGQILYCRPASSELEETAIHAAIQYKAIREYQRLRDLGKLP
jgi:hypothetical protein